MGWRSTVHASQPPSGSKAATQPRLSIPFHRPHDDAGSRACHVVSTNPAKYAPVSAGEHLRRKLGIPCNPLLCLALSP